MAKFVQRSFCTLGERHDGVVFGSMHPVWAPVSSWLATLMGSLDARGGTVTESWAYRSTGFPRRVLWQTLPPMRSRASKTVTSKSPFSSSTSAARRPATPAPMMAITGFFVSVDMRAGEGRVLGRGAVEDEGWIRGSGALQKLGRRRNDTGDEGGTRCGGACDGRKCGRSPGELACG